MLSMWTKLRIGKPAQKWAPELSIRCWEAGMNLSTWRKWQDAFVDMQQLHDSAPLLPDAECSMMRHGIQTVGKPIMADVKTLNELH